MRNASALILWNSGQHFISGLEIFSHHRGLILKHRQQQWEAHNVEFLVAQVETIVVGYVAEQVHLPVQMRNCAYLAAHIIIESIQRVCINETVAHPHACLHRLIDFIQHLCQNSIN